MSKENGLSIYCTGRLEDSPLFTYSVEVVDKDLFLRRMKEAKEQGEDIPTVDISEGQEWGLKISIITAQAAARGDKP